ncbi:NAD(P)-binding protein [Lindgomyces ingoldianus]|uniref:NAD(P)-binding protein n=1 Tax=Lindgomyces ingoldianus TaxID=673940 RepID=A0ACB6QSU0_9PLEO|nr:NAD(P)-binding protein [Lindgomyces ingoldianus]KAF2470053.1 NAD(P)-binding protein [Lindgomyces ingoldianus]
MLLSSKVIALTGGASGIGLATAHLLASRGAIISIADVNKEALDVAANEIRTKHGAEVMSMVVDVRKPEQVEKWIKSVVGKYGRLDGAANLAGVIGKSIGVKGITAQDISEWDFIMDVNLKGVMLCLKSQLQVISKGGAIVNAASIAGLQGRPNNAAYAASKHGVIGLTRSAAKEVGAKGVRVNCICPGYIETPMNASARAIAESSGTGEDKHRNSEAMGVALKRSGKAEEVASLIAFLLGDESKFITGASYSIDGGWNC